MVVWSTILILYGVGLGFGSPNFNLNYYVRILILKPPSNNTSSIIFFPMCTWITAIWLSIVIIAIPTSGTKEPTCFFVVAIFKFWVFFGFNFYHKYLFNSGAILSNCPKIKVYLVSSIYLSMSKKIYFIVISFFCELTTFWDFCVSTKIMFGILGQVMFHPSMDMDGPFFWVYVFWIYWIISTIDFFNHSSFS